MDFRPLGTTGTVVSRIALGTMYFGNETPEDEALQILDTFVDSGANLIDTSNVYVGGESQRIVGRWLASRPAEVTDRVVLATKGRFSINTDVNGPGLSRRNLGRSLDESLRDLGRENIDLYQLHAWDPLTPVEETLGFLDDAVRAGKITYVGLSNFTGWQTQLIVSTARAMGAPVPVSLQVQYSLLSREVEWEMVPAAEHNGLSVLPWSPLAGGLLSGKYTRGSTAPRDTRAGGDDQLYRWQTADYVSTDRAWTIIDTVRSVAAAAGLTPSQVAIGWLTNRDTVLAPIFGARTVEQLRDNLGAAEVQLDSEAIALLDQVSFPTPPNTYPYGQFGISQRDRNPENRNVLMDLVAAGSDDPLKS